MNKGYRNSPKYVCDKCGKELYFVHHRGYIDVVKYFRADKETQGVPKKAFDLCKRCEKKLMEWLEFKEMPNLQNIIDEFPRWEEN